VNLGLHKICILLFWTPLVMERLKFLVRAISQFFLEAGSQHDEGAKVAPGGSSSASIGKLWPDIDEV
jgi:hypothetical protein